MKYGFIILIPFFLACYVGNKSIKIKGSDTEVNLTVSLVESFRNLNQEMFISISGGGSGLGIASLLNGVADIANSSRRINTQELELFAKKNIKIDSFVFAQDAIAFVVSDQLGIDSISMDQLTQILSGNVNNWVHITSQDLPINIYGRQSNSGTYDFIRAKLNIRFSPNAKQMNGNAQILEAIKVDHSGIGYVGAGYVMKGKDHGIKVLKVYSDHGTSISPLDPDKIASHLYYFQRPLFQYFKIGDYSKIKPFLDFEKTTTGLSIIKSAGYYPVSSPL